MKTKFSLILATSIVLFTSCATIFTGTKDRISFTTNPAGATVYIDGIEQCKTPCSTGVKRKLGNNDVEFKLDGYDARIITLSKEFNIISVINLTNLLGWGIDALSGAMMQYDKKAYDIELTKDKKVSMILPSRIEINTKKKTVAVYVQAK